jgi:hypothetical protein
MNAAGMAQGQPEAKDDEVYRLTPFGLLGPAMNAAIIQRLKMHGCNAMVLNDEGDLEWASVEKGL